MDWECWNALLWKFGLFRCCQSTKRKMMVVFFFVEEEEWCSVFKVAWDSASVRFALGYIEKWKRG